MGLYIKDMEIPCEEAEPLRLELYADGTVIVIKEQDDFYEFKAVPIHPHGRCIDADVMKTKIDGNAPIVPTLLEWIDAQPTIIPTINKE